MTITPKFAPVTFSILAGNGERVEIAYPTSEVYHLEDEIRQFFGELHLPEGIADRFLLEYPKSGIDYRKFLSQETTASVDPEFWWTYRHKYGMWHEPCLIGGAYIFLLSVDMQGDIVVLMNRLNMSPDERCHRYSPIGTKYRNWRYLADGQQYHASEPSYLLALRKCKEKRGISYFDELVFFSRENSTSYTNGGQVIDLAESNFYIRWFNYNKLRSYIGNSEDGTREIIKVKELANTTQYPRATCCKRAIARLIEQYAS